MSLSPGTVKLDLDDDGDMLVLWIYEVKVTGTPEALAKYEDAEGTLEVPSTCFAQNDDAKHYVNHVNQHEGLLAAITPRKVWL